MPRPLRLEYPGALYHVSCRTNRAEPVFGEPAAREHFLAELGTACAKTGWRVHAWSLLPDHAHVVLETPQPNLVGGMKWWLGTFTNRYNRRRGLSGHLFAGRYRAVPVAPGGSFFLEACLHVLLNPARAGLLAPEQPVVSHPATSAAWCVRPPGERPAWLATDRLFAAAGLPEDSPEARRAFAEWLEARRAASEPPSWRMLRRGWCCGDEAFRAELLERWRGASRDPRRGPVPHEAQVQLGWGIVAEELSRRGWTIEELARRRKTDPDKAAIAQRLRRETALSLRWIAAALHMGSINTLRNTLVAAERGGPRRAMSEATALAESGPRGAASPPPAPVSAGSEPEVVRPAAGEETFDVTWD